MLETKYIIAALIVVFMIICIWHYGRCHSASRAEGLHCGCERRDAAMFAWGSDDLPQCDPRFSGQMPYKNPNGRPCARHVFNPFFPPFGSAPAYIGSSSQQFIDVPISRMVGDHVPLE